MDVITACVVFLHAIGLVLLLINWRRLVNKYAYDDGQNTAGDEESADIAGIRCTFACNLLVFYHVALLVLEIVILVLCYTDRNIFGSITANLCDTAWFSAIFNYLFLIGGIMPRAHYDERADIGFINSTNLLALGHFVVLWTSLFHLLIMRDFGVQVVFALISYCFMRFDARANQENVAVPNHIIPKQEAINIVNRRLKAQPFVRWNIVCGHWIVYGDEAEFVERDRESKTYEFNNTPNWTVKNPLGSPSCDLFKGNYLKLDIRMEVIPADTPTRKEVAHYGEEFRKTHEGHEPVLNMDTQMYFTERYLVCDDIQVLPSLFKPGAYDIFTYLGLCLPYRWFLFLSMGHVNYKIKKYVYAEQSEEGNPGGTLIINEDGGEVTRF